MFPILAFWPLLIPIIIFFVVFRLGPRLFRGVFRDLESDRNRARLYDVGRTPYPAVGRYGREMESVVFRVAYRLKGRITVSDVIVETGLGMKDAEDLINGMVDGARVRMEVNEENGLVIYEFPEIIDRFDSG